MSDLYRRFLKGRLLKKNEKNKDWFVYIYTSPIDLASFPSHVSKKMASNENLDVEALKSRIDEQGNLVRKIKSDPNRKVCHKNNLNNFFFFNLSCQG